MEQQQPKKVAKPGDTIVAFIFGGIIILCIVTGLVLAGTF